MVYRKKQIKLTKEQQTAATAQIKEYLETEFELEISGLQAEIFLDFLSKKIGGYYYNVGIEEAMALMNERIEDLYLLMKEEN